MPYDSVVEKYFTFQCRGAKEGSSQQKQKTAASSSTYVNVTFILKANQVSNLLFINKAD